MSKETHKFYINIGDWSCDGHNQCDRFLFESNYSVKELQKAYKKSCKTTGVNLSRACAEGYEDPTVEPSAAKKLLELGLSEELVRGEDYDPEYCHETEYAINGPDAMADMIVWFVGLSMPEDFECRRTEEHALNFNGFWGDLNESFGYGLYR
jgi:hypothetical protein